MAISTESAGVAPREPSLWQLALGSGGMSALGAAALMINMPALPLIQAEFALPLTLVQLMLSVSFMIGALGQYFMGYLADALGLRSVVRSSLALIVAGSMAAAVAPSFSVLFGAVIVQMFGATACFALFRIIVTVQFSATQRARALAIGIFPSMLVPIVAPAVGGFVSDAWGWRANFLLIGSVAAAYYGYIHWSLPDTGARSRVALSFGPLLRLLRNRIFSANMAQYAFQMSGALVFNTTAPHVAKSFGIGAAQYGLFNLIPAIATAAGTIIAGQLLRKITTNVLIVGGTLLGITSAATMLGLMAFSAQPVLALFICAGFYQMAATLTVAAAQTNAISSAHDATGLASGFLGFAIYAVGGVLVQLASLLLGYGVLALPAMLLFSCVASLLLFFWIRRGAPA
jgi:MFS transporter, DHA1 family, multidrug resistance protein